jgi:hypothetical protein
VIVAGFVWYSGDDRHEVAIVGSGNRAHADALAARAPENCRAQVISYFKPFAEGQRPEASGQYLYYAEVSTPVSTKPRLSHVWWKPVDVVVGDK